MKKNSLTGWKDVFTFTLTQTLKSKAYIISFAILLALMLISMPIVSALTSKDSSGSTSPSTVKKIYVNNKTNISTIDFQNLIDETLKHISFEPMKEDYTAVSERIEKSEQESIILTISEVQDKYSLEFVRATKGPVKESTLNTLADSIKKEFETIKFNSLGVNSTQLDMINAEVKTKVFTTDVNGIEVVKEDTSISGSEYGFIYGILFIVMMVNIMASTQIASSILTEKSTRVIEYLLTSVKPLAIMIGKILAMLTAVLFQVISMIVALFISNIISRGLSSSSGESVLSQFLPKNIFQNLNITNIIFCLILIGVGMIFYATLAGLAGASVSRLEELSEGLTLFTLINLIGAYVGMGAASVLMASGINGFVIFSFLFPLSSVFILPGALLIGKVTLPFVAAAIALQIITIMLLFKFVAKVYETLILHNGNKIKLKELIKISKTV
ncbi:ABC transporter permease [Clostridium tunisiense]|uniref:ABC transporter permease n=1 Tax=Clostridium tunisiense TaxID=219748 RepID=UPI00031923F2|nr:ABC transporter permease [Clostridium tunisiense]